MDPKTFNKQIHNIYKEIAKKLKRKKGKKDDLIGYDNPSDLLKALKNLKNERKS